MKRPISLERVNERLHRQEGTEWTVSERSRQRKLAEETLVLDACSRCQHTLFLDRVAHTMTVRDGNRVSVLLGIVGRREKYIATHVRTTVANVRNNQFVLVSGWSGRKEPT